MCVWNGREVWKIPVTQGEVVDSGEIFLKNRLGKIV